MITSFVRPYQYPLLVGAVLGTGLPQTVIKTATVVIPDNSSFVWTHTLNATLQTAPDGLVSGASVRLQLYDSISGPLSNVEVEVANLAGAIYQTFAAAPRDVRPYPLPEAFTFERGAVITATYTVALTVNDSNPSLSSVGVILCGYRVLQGPLIYAGQGDR